MSLLRNLARGALGSAVNGRTAGRGILGAGVGLVATRIAMRSLPGAAVVGGGLLAKYLWDRKRERDTRDQSGMTREDADMATGRASGETIMAESTAPEPNTTPL